MKDPWLYIKKEKDIPIEEGLYWFLFLAGKKYEVSLCVLSNDTVTYNRFPVNAVAYIKLNKPPVPTVPVEKKKKEKDKGEPF